MGCFLVFSCYKFISSINVWSQELSHLDFAHEARPSSHLVNSGCKLTSVKRDEIRILCEGSDEGFRIGLIPAINSLFIEAANGRFFYLEIHNTFPAQAVKNSTNMGAMAAESTLCG